MATGSTRFLDKLAQGLFADVPARQAFTAAVLGGQAGRPAVLWCQPRPEVLPFRPRLPHAWQPDFVDQVEPEARPGAHPLHQAGHYYCLDLSSVWAAAGVLAVPQPWQQVIDVCAAPGGKAIFAWAAGRPGHLVCNETVGKRLGMLSANLKRCQVSPVTVTHLDPARLATLYAHQADLVLVDAPCSGQSLVARGEPNPGCFHPLTLQRNANRQKRILAHALALLRPGGYLTYTTCTYALEENEAVCTWLIKRFPQVHGRPVPTMAEFQSHLTSLPCYRLWPHQGYGAGGFMALLQRQD
ncbi:MAG: RsmB/NOP family class I SAM-dependent RNA methyltransferase [Gloeomargaritaceae cyanobacterium C42_A2020_066]|nr:RsmB/NOP family class I SAM-dependent RNA methyltransferase [Gloeomargaritaceae cyanobacterium C42_A2020_066]